jgi:hypothetical protein
MTATGVPKFAAAIVYKTLRLSGDELLEVFDFGHEVFDFEGLR